MNYRRRNRSLNIFSSSNRGKTDTVMLTIMASLTVFGLIMVYSASFIGHSNPFYFFIRQLIFVTAGAFIALVAYLIDYRLLSKLVIPGMIFSVILLLIILIPGIGKEVQGATRWIDLGFFDVQPSEIAKLTFIVYLAAWASNQNNEVRSRRELNSLKTHFEKKMLPMLVVLAIVCGLVLIQPDLATAGIIGMTSLAMYFLSGRDIYHIFGAILMVAAFGVFGITAAVLEPYRLARVETYVDFFVTGEVQDPLGDGYQLKNILTAVGSGGIFGVGFGESRQKFHYLGQTAFTDNIFAVIAEEFGVVGSVILTSAYYYLFVRGMKLASQVKDPFGQLLASGIIIWIALQALLHIATNVGLIPVTGITLPYISYGGSSAIIILAASGLYLNIIRK